MDALDQQLLTRRIDRIEHKLDRLIEILTTPPTIIRTNDGFTTEDAEKLRKALYEGGRSVLLQGGPRIEYIGPTIQAEDFEDV